MNAITAVYFDGSKHYFDFPKGATFGDFRKFLTLKNNHPIDKIFDQQHYVAKLDYEEIPSGELLKYQIHLRAD